MRRSLSVHNCWLCAVNVCNTVKQNIQHSTVVGYTNPKLSPKPNSYCWKVFGFRLVFKSWKVDNDVLHTNWLTLLSLSLIMNYQQLYSSCTQKDSSITNWRAPWKNRISSTTMKLRRSLVKPVTWQNISRCLVLPPEIVMHEAFNVICRYMHHHAWQSRVEEPNNSI